MLGLLKRLDRSLVAPASNTSRAPACASAMVSLSTRPRPETNGGYIFGAWCVLSA